MEDDVKLRIYIVGAQSTGKTTLLNYIADRYNINRITEVARQVLAKYGNNLREIRSNMDKCKSFQRDILEEQIEKERLTEEPFICDRGLDILAYFCHHNLDTYEILNKDYTKEYIESYKNKNVVVLFIRPEEELVKDDGIRGDLTTETIYRIDGMIKYILESNNINYISIQSKHMNERIRALQSIFELKDIR